MIVADIRHVDHQISMTSRFRKAIEFLQRPDIQEMADGRVDIDGERVFALFQRYETIVTGVPRFEYHRKYIDIQYIVSGEEVIGWAPAERMTVTEAYDVNRDICFGTVPAAEITPVCLREGQLAVLYPEDGHAPKMAAGASSSVFKVVVKIAAN